MNDHRSERLLVLAPRGRDTELTCKLLAANGHEAEPCANGAALIAGIIDGAGAALVTHETLSPELRRDLARVLSTQPPWSDFPLILLAQGDTHGSMLELGNVSVLERPIATATLLAAVRSALRGRRRQYDARAAIQQRDQFLAMLGHELRNPLGAIVLATELVTKGGTDKLAARMEMIARQAKHLTRLVDDLLDVARVTTGKVALRREAVDLDDVIDATLAALDEHARAHSIELVVERCAATIHGDPVRLQQIVTNLVANAIKYSPPDTTVTIISKIVGENWQLRVRDQGVGIPPEIQPHVFDLFVQAETNLARAEGGMGIGLTLVDRLVRLHGGTVQVFSEGANTGTELVVTLPLGKPPMRNAPVHVAIEHSSNGLRVVLVEDNPDVRELEQAMLESMGCHVTAVADGRSGLDTILATRPDLAIVDIGLPGMDGYEIAQHARTQLGTSLRMVAVTGYGQPSDERRSIDAGFDAHYTKPLAASKVQSMLDSARRGRSRSSA